MTFSARSSSLTPSRNVANCSPRSLSAAMIAALLRQRLLLGAARARSTRRTSRNRCDPTRLAVDLDLPCRRHRDVRELLGHALHVGRRPEAVLVLGDLVRDRDRVRPHAAKRISQLSSTVYLIVSSPVRPRGGARPDPRNHPVYQAIEQASKAGPSSRYRELQDRQNADRLLLPAYRGVQRTADSATRRDNILRVYRAATAASKTFDPRTLLRFSKDRGLAVLPSPPSGSPVPRLSRFRRAPSRRAAYDPRSRRLRPAVLPSSGCRHCRGRPATQRPSAT